MGVNILFSLCATVPRRHSANTYAGDVTGLRPTHQQLPEPEIIHIHDSTVMASYLYNTCSMPPPYQLRVYRDGVATEEVRGRYGDTTEALRRLDGNDTERQLLVLFSPSS